VIELPTDDPRGRALWIGLLDLADLQSASWTLIGAQMVALHASEHGVTPGRLSVDADILFDVRLVSEGPSVLAKALLSLGFELAGISATGVGHRFQRGPAIIDVLAPEGVGERARTDVLSGAHTVQVPGGSQALTRSEYVEVVADDRPGRIRRPNLLGAILLKARAIEVDDVPDAQRSDLALLLSLVEDPFVLRSELKPTERKWLARHAELTEPAHGAWTDIENAGDGQAALAIFMSK